MAESEARIWGIRGLIQRLEDAKDDVTALFGAQTALDEAGREMWIGDAKETYYGIVMAWQMLRGASRTDRKYAMRSRWLLDAAQSRASQTLSELKVVPGDPAAKLHAAFREAFDACYHAISSELERYEDRREPVPPDVRVRKAGEREYELLCAVCGAVAVVFKIGIPQFEDREGLIYAGITKSTSLDMEDAAKIFGWLESDRIPEVHAFVQKYSTMEDGIDAYCPTCDKVYCRGHYQMTEEWDAGFYDCSYGVCPLGHKRIIDD